MRSKTKARPWWENPELVKEYRARNERCELWDRIGRLVTGKHRPEWDKLEVHHIWGTMQMKHDNWSNLIVLQKSLHNEQHFGTRFPKEVRLACIWRKVVKKECDWGELREASGRNVLAWVEDNCRDVDEPWASFRMDILERN